MRELKFRVWDATKGVFLRSYGNRGEDFLYSGRFVAVTWFIQCARLENPTRFFIQQYTSLKDKNGREIYEGDILKYEFSDILCTVKWSKEDNDCHPCFVMNDLSSQRGEVEIVGNIHENPSLLT